MKIEAGVAATEELDRAEDEGIELERREMRRLDPHRAGGHRREAAAHRGQPAPGGVHRQALRGPRHAVPRPHPGRQPGPYPRGGEVRLHARASSSPRTPPGGSARPSRAPSPTRRAPSASPCTWWRPSTSSCASSASCFRSSAASPAPRRSARRWACPPNACARFRRSAQEPVSPGNAHRRGGGLPAGRLHRGRRRRGAARRRDASRMLQEQLSKVLDGLAERERKVHQAALRPGGRPSAHARGGGQRVRRHARAHPPDREQDAREAAPPQPLEQAERLSGRLRFRRPDGRRNEADAAKGPGTPPCRDGEDSRTEVRFAFPIPSIRGTRALLADLLRQPARLGIRTCKLLFALRANRPRVRRG